MLPNPQQLLDEFAPLRLTAESFRSNADLTLIETASREFLRLKNFYGFLRNCGLVEEQYEQLFIKLGKQGLQRYLTETLRQFYSQVESRFFDAMRNFFQQQQRQLSYNQTQSQAAQLPSRYLLNGKVDPGFCYFVYGVFCSLELIPEYRDAFFGHGQQLKSAVRSPSTSAMMSSRLGTQSFRDVSDALRGGALRPSDGRLAEIAQTITVEEVKNKQLALQMQHLQAEKQQILDHTQRQLTDQRELIRTQTSQQEAQLQEIEALRVKLHGSSIRLQSVGEQNQQLEQQLQSSQQQIKQLSGETAVAKTESAELRQQREKQQQQILQLTEEKEALKTQLTKAFLDRQQGEVNQYQLQQSLAYQKELKSSLQTAIQENTDLVQKYNSLLAAHKQVSGQVKQSEDELQNLRHKTSLQGQRIQDLVQSNQELEDRVRQARLDVERYQQNSQNTEVRVSGLSAENTSLQKQLIEQERAVHDAQFQLKQSKQNIVDMQAEMQQLQQGKQWSAKEITRLNEELSGKDIETQSLKNTQKQLEAVIKQLKESLEKLEETEVLSQQLKLELTSERCAKQALQDDFAVQQQDYKFQIQQLMAQVQQLQERSQDYEKQRDQLLQLEAQIGALTIKLHDAEAGSVKLEKFQETDDALRAERRERQNITKECAAAQEQLIQAQQELEEKQQLIREIEEQFQELQKQQPEYTKAFDRLAELEQENARLAKENAVLTQQVKQQGATAGTVTMQEHQLLMEDYKQLMQEKEFIEQFQLVDLRKENAKASQDLEELRAQLQQLRAERDALQEAAAKGSQSFLYNSQQLGAAELKDKIKQILKEDSQQQQGYSDLDMLDALDQDPERFLTVMAGGKKKTDAERLREICQKLREL